MYLDYIEDNYSYHFNYTDYLLKDFLSYSFIYLDDDIPEIFITTHSEAGGEMVLAFNDGKVNELSLYRTGSQYIERSGLIYTDTGHMGEYPVTITKLENGFFTEIGKGVYRLIDDEIVEELEYEYEWEGKKVSENTTIELLAKNHFLTKTII